MYTCSMELLPNPRLLGITGNYWGLLEITADYWGLLGITGDYWRLLGNYCVSCRMW